MQSITIILLILVLSCVNCRLIHGKKNEKDLGFMTEMDLEKLYDQWEENDEPLPDDELPPHKRPPPAVNLFDGQSFDKISNDPEQFHKLAKKGKTLMTFVTVANSPSRAETEEITGRWQIGLHNAHIRCQRFIVSDDRAIFVYEDGSQAYEAKKFLLDQPELKEYSIENQSFHGKGYPQEDTNSIKTHSEL